VSRLIVFVRGVLVLWHTLLDGRGNPTAKPLYRPRETSPFRRACRSNPGVGLVWTRRQGPHHGFSVWSSCAPVAPTGAPIRVVEGAVRGVPLLRSRLVVLFMWQLSLQMPRWSSAGARPRRCPGRSSRRCRRGRCRWSRSRRGRARRGGSRCGRRVQVQMPLVSELDEQARPGENSSWASPLGPIRRPHASSPSSQPSPTVI